MGKAFCYCYKDQILIQIFLLFVKEFIIFVSSAVLAQNLMKKTTQSIKRDEAMMKKIMFTWTYCICALHNCLSIRKAVKPVFARNIGGEQILCQRTPFLKSKFSFKQISPVATFEMATGLLLFSQSLPRFGQVMRNVHFNHNAIVIKAQLKATE